MNTGRKFAIACTFAILTGGTIAAVGKEAAQTFASPQEGFSTLATAIRSHDTKTLKAILGSDGDAIISSGDPVADKEAGAVFLAAYDIHSKLVQPDSMHTVLEVGDDDWPMPIPMVKGNAGWHFDTAAGKDELLARRIGRNEIYTIQACLTYVDAQFDYASDDRGDGVIDYAQRFISTPNKRDGLYWPVAAGDPKSPLGPAFAVQRFRGYALAKSPSPDGTPFHGYLYKILTAQGSSAPGGAYSYLANGKMIGGFALVAYPVRYGVSGVMTFLVNQDGVVYQKDLGPGTATVAEKMTVFNPGKGWTNSES
jgi:hypothetical protein